MNELFLIALAAVPEVDAKSVVAEAMRANPTVEAAVLDARRAAQDLRAEEERWFPTLVLETSASRTQTPSLRNGSTDVIFPSGDRFLLASELKHTFSFGTALSFRVEGSRSTNTAQLVPGTDQVVVLGPGYGLLGRLSLTQPLLRGFGTDFGEAALRQARLGKTAADRARDEQASAILRDVLVAYWELWYAEQALKIDREAFALAVQQRDQAAAQIAAGSLAPVEIYTFETRVAELEQATVASESGWQQQALALEALLGRDQGSNELHAADASAPEVSPRERTAVFAAAEARSFELARLRATLAIAEDQALVAGEADRARLDLTAALTAQGLGNQQVPPIFEQLGAFDAVSAQAGLVFELPFSDRRHAVRQSASLLADRAKAQLTATAQSLRATAGAEVVKLAQAKQRITLTTRAAEIAGKNANAQKERYDSGDAILLQVYEAQDSLRRAQLGIQRSRVDAVEAGLRIDHLTGELLGKPD